MQFHDLVETFTQQDVDLNRVFNDVAVYNAHVSDAAHMENVASLACRSALTKRGVAHISIASDVQEQSEEDAERSKRNRSAHVPNVLFEQRGMPTDEEINRAADLLNGAKKIAILAGRGALSASSELERTAELLGAPIAKALLGKAVLPDNHPLTTGGIGILGTLPSQEIMERCDAILIVGSTFPYIEYYPKPGQARGVQIDRDPQRLGLRFPVEIGLAGDTAETLNRLNERLVQKADRTFLEQAQGGMARWREKMAEAEDATVSPLMPQAVVRAFGRRLASDAILASDSGQNTELAARHIDLRQGQAYALSGGLASMSCGLAYAIAGGIAFPGRQIAAVIGDGGFAMQLGEFSTAVRYGIPLKLLVIKNNMLNQIAWEQMMFLGNPQFACELQPIDFAMAAEAMGGKGFRLAEPAEIDKIMDEAFATEGPVVIEALVDKYEPMMPPKMSKDYAENFRKALPETEGRQQIEQNLAREPLKSMMRQEESADVDPTSRMGLPGTP
jgi:pyruvate dehydrogenase (quinone)